MVGSRRRLSAGGPDRLDREVRRASGARGLDPVQFNRKDSSFGVKFCKPPATSAISVAFSGKNKKTLFILARCAKDPQRNPVAQSAQAYSISMIAQGFKKHAK
jgi:hypothetical protein